MAVVARVVGEDIVDLSLDNGWMAGLSGILVNDPM